MAQLTEELSHRPDRTSLGRWRMISAIGVVDLAEVVTEEERVDVEAEAVPRREDPHPKQRISTLNWTRTEIR